MGRLSKILLALALLGSLLWPGAPAALYAGVAAPPASALMQQTGEPVYALQGSLGRATNQNFDTFLLAADGTAYALVGQDPTVEQQITGLRDQGAIVKVWGTVFPQGRVSATPEIVVSNILPVASSEIPPTPTPRPNVPTAVVRNSVVNIRTGPGSTYESVGLVSQGNQCLITGRDPTNTWWQVQQCTGGLTGWILQQLVDIMGDTANVPVAAAPAPPPPPAPPPLPQTFFGWKAEFFPNRDLSGSPAVVQDVPEVNFNWGTGSAPGVSATNFSARFTRTINFNPGTYRFRARSDDGVRVFVDGQPIINQWFIQSANTEYTADRSMYGNQTVVVEYFQADGGAQLYFTFDPLSSSQTVDGGGSGEWQASYYNNTDLAGNPALIRREPRSSYPLDQDWGYGSPASGIVNDDNWSARWVGNFNFDPGDYSFQTRTDDGVRVYIDGLRVIDAWSDGFKEPSNRFRRLGGGNHQITIEFYERGGTAFNRVWWWRESGSSGGGGIPRDD
jgi:hypothetical protein